ncbi:MAG: B12-binding domain-containing radical SAM protein, partial [Deltaproteobacteria bacterium]|nr:B12-binding domain-containing radical SAM protein [Deltaproteobacteria bacterium]
MSYQSTRRRVFLIQASAFERAFDHSMPLGLMALTAYLRRERECVVRIFDMQHDCLGIERVVDDARGFDPDFIGIGGMSTDAEVIHALARRLKATFPDVPLVVGGAHAGHRAEDLADLADIDYVIAGEGEIATVALLDHLDGWLGIEDVPSLVRRDTDRVVRTDSAPPILDLDSLPFPAIDAIEVDAYYRISRPGYFYARRRYAVVMTSRGCPFGCSYCHHIHGRKYRYRSPENVLAEMEMLRSTVGAQEFVFLDDLLNLPAGRLERIAELIVDRNWGVALNMPTGLRGDLMSEETLR